MTGTPTTMPALAAGAAAAELTSTAHRDGLAAGVRRAFDPAEPVPCSAAGYTLLPAGCAAAVARWWLPDRELAPDQVRVSTPAHPLAASEGFELLRVTPTGVPPGPAPGRRGYYPLALVAVRLGVTRAVLDLAMMHLGERQFDGSPLTSRQLVQAAIADIGTALETCHHGLPADLAGTDPDAALHAAGWLHARLDRADASLSTMFGAAGYLTDHPARRLHVVALVRDAWVDPLPADSDGGEG